MRRASFGRAPARVWAACVILGGVSASATPSLAQPPSPADNPAATAAMAALMQVCRPAAEQDQPASVFAERLGYAPEAELPPGLPIVHPGARSWRVPATTGEVHVISGAMPEPAQRSACMVAVYGDPVSGFETELTRRLTAPDLGFERDVQQSFRTDRFQITHYDSSRGYLVRNVMAVRELAPVPTRPAFSVIAFRVDYSWLRSVSH